jgi:hypothetical protein
VDVKGRFRAQLETQGNIKRSDREPSRLAAASNAPELLDLPGTLPSSRVQRAGTARGPVVLYGALPKTGQAPESDDTATRCREMHGLLADLEAAAELVSMRAATSLQTRDEAVVEYARQATG